MKDRNPKKKPVRAASAFKQEDYGTTCINKNGGTSIAVYREIKDDNGMINEQATMKPYNEGYHLAIESKRAEQLLPADYSAGKSLKMALLGYVEKLAKRIN